MSDRYTAFVSSNLGSTLAKQLGLPRPVELRRFSPGEPLLTGPALVAAAPGGSRFAASVAPRLRGSGVDVLEGVQESDDGSRLAAVVLDASGITQVAELEALRAILAPAVKRLGRCGRVVVIGTDPQPLADPHQRACQRSLEGFIRTLGKELRAGATANLVLGQPESVRDTVDGVSAAVEFFLSGRSAYVDGQVLRVGGAAEATQAGADHAGDPDKPLAGKLALVTGAARGIGAVVAQTLARDGARVIAVDVPAAGQALAATANQLGGVALQLDITRPDAGRRLADHPAVSAGLDILVHNAGITRDKLLVNLDESRWNSVLSVNLQAQLAIDDALLAQGGPLTSGSRLVSVSSMAGIAGNRGQTNYATSKAGVIGMVTARAEELAGRGMTYNAVAPGFIETEMTAKIPFATRELGRRLNSLSQGGRPIDVAEAISFFTHPASAGITGQVLRVCGQSLLGA